MRTLSSLGSSRQRLRRAAVALAVVLVAGCDYAVGAASGQLDPAFGGGDGVVTFAGRARSDEDAKLAARQPDGKVVVLAQQGSSVVLVRYLPDGTFDPGFGRGGVARTAIGSSVFKKLIVAPDGDIVVVGASFTGSSLTGWLVARFDGDGAPAAGFGTNGIAGVFGGLEPAAPFGGVDGVVAAGDDLYLHAERFGFNDVNDSVVAKVGPTGAVDTGFGPDGTGTVRIGDATVAGNAFAIHFGDLALRSDGTLAASFAQADDAGIRTVTPAGEVTGTISYGAAPVRPHRVDEVDVGEDGSILVAGTEDDTSSSDHAVVLRIGPDGTLDPGFGTGGVATVGIPVRFVLGVEPSGSGVLLAGDGVIPGGNRISTARLTAAGTLDPAYGDAGIATYDDDAELAGLVATSSGAVVVGATGPSSGSPSDILLLGIDAAGALDPAFGDGGRARPDIGQEGSDEFTVTAPLPDGDLLVAGDTGDGLIAGRYDPDGTPDADRPPAALLAERFVGAHVVRDAAVAVDGSAFLLVEIGSGLPDSFTGGGGTGWLVIKLGPDGGIDASFGDAGVYTLPGASFPNAIGIQPDGTVLVAWTVIHPAVPIPPHGIQPPTFDLRVDALTPAGAPDTSFGQGGSILHPTQGASAPPGPPFTGGMAIGPGGKAYLVGYGLSRLDPDGTAFTPATLPAGVSFAAADVAVDAGGRVLATGSGATGGQPATDVVARFDAGLVLDTSFGSGGLAPLPALRAGVKHAGPVLLVGPDGRMTVVERSQSTDPPLTYEDLVIRRLTAAGAADTTFSGDGEALGVFRPLGPDLPMIGAALAGDDVLIAGSVGPRSGSSTGQDAALALVNG